MITVIDGDFGQDKLAVINHPLLSLKFESLEIGPGLFSSGETIFPEDIAEVTQITDRASVDAGGFLVGAALAGIAGAIIGGHGSAVTFVVKLTDGRKFLAEGDSDEFKSIYGVLFRSTADKERDKEKRAEEKREREKPPEKGSFAYTWQEIKAENKAIWQEGKAADDAKAAAKACAVAGSPQKQDTWHTLVKIFLICIFCLFILSCAGLSCVALGLSS